MDRSITPTRRSRRPARIATWNIKVRLRLASTSDRACTQCHADLTTTHGPSKFVSNIRGFDSSHPEFAVLRGGYSDPGTIKFNHQVHLKEDLRGANGPVQLKCADCHQPSDSSDRAYMAPVNYDKHCASCHTLQFDRRFSESAPHKDPKVVYDFVLAKLTAYIAAHPAEIPLVDEPDKRLPSRPPQPPARNAAEWVQQRMADAQLLLWRKSCKECHQISYPERPRCPARGSQVRDHHALAAARGIRSQGASNGAMRIVPCQGERQPRDLGRSDPRGPNAASNAITRVRTQPKRVASNVTSIMTGARKSR